MSNENPKTLSIEENVFLLKCFKVFKLIENGVPVEVAALNQDSSSQPEKTAEDLGNTKNYAVKSQMEDEMVSRNLATNSLVLNSNSDKIISADIKDYRLKGEKIALNKVAKQSELFEKIAACYRNVYRKSESCAEVPSAENIYTHFFKILVDLCEEYESSYYSRYFIKISTTLLQFKSDAELLRDQTWAKATTLFNENLKTSNFPPQKHSIGSKEHDKTGDDNLLNIIDEDDMLLDNKTNSNISNKHLANKQLKNKGFFTTPTSPSWINNFLTQNEDENGIPNNEFIDGNDNDYLMENSNMYGKKRDSFASYNSFGDSHNPPPPSVAGSSAFDLPNTNILLDSNAINEIESSLMNLQQQNCMNSPDKSDILAMAAAEASNRKRKNSLRKPFEFSQAVSDEDDVRPPGFADFHNHNNYSALTNPTAEQKVSKKKKNSRRFTSSASSANLAGDKSDIKNSIYQQQIENLKKIGNRSATLFKGQLSQHQQNANNYDQQQLQYDSLFKNIKNNSGVVPTDLNFMKYDSNVEQQIKEQIMSNAALNSLYDDNTNFDRFSDLLANPNESYMNAQMKNNKVNASNYRESNYHYGKNFTNNFEKLYTSPAQLRSQNGNSGSNMISTIPEDPQAPLMNYQSFAKNNKSYSSVSSSNRSSKPAGRNNKFHFVTKKQLQQKNSKVPSDLSKTAGNNIINNSNYNSVMSYLNHLNNTGNRFSKISTDYGIPQGLQAGGFPNSNYNNNNNNNLLMKKMEDTIAEKNKTIADLTGKMETMKEEIGWLRKVVMTDMTAMRKTNSGKKTESDIISDDTQRDSPQQKTKDTKNVTVGSTGENGKPVDKKSLTLTSSSTPPDSDLDKIVNKKEASDLFIKGEDKAKTKEQVPSKNPRNKRFKFDFKVKKGNKLAA